MREKAISTLCFLHVLQCSLLTLTKRQKNIVMGTSTTAIVMGTSTRAIICRTQYSVTTTFWLPRYLGSLNGAKWHSFNGLILTTLIATCLNHRSTLLHCVPKKIIKKKEFAENFIFERICLKLPNIKKVLPI